MNASRFDDAVETSKELHDDDLVQQSRRNGFTPSQGCSPGTVSLGYMPPFEYKMVHAVPIELLFE